MGFLMALVLEGFFWWSTREYITLSSQTPPVGHGVGLVLGTSRLTREGLPNTFFEGRMITAAKLYNEK
jgi:vancomycin permeability regulator SanA